MTERQLAELRHRIAAGEQLTEELWVIRKSHLECGLDASRAEGLSDVWNLAFHREGVFPKLEAAKALVDTALASDTCYPVLTNDGLVYDALSPGERQELVGFIRKRLDETNAPVARHVLEEFIDDLLGDGPQV